MNPIRSFYVALLMVAFLQSVHAQGRKELKLFPHYDSATRLYGYVDEKGRTVIPYKYSQAEIFSEGLAAVRMGREGSNNGWGFIDVRDSVVIPFRFMGTSQFFYKPMPFYKGFTRIYFNGQERLMNRSQEFFHWNQSLTYRQGLAKIWKAAGETLVAGFSGESAEFGFVNEKGDLQVPVKFKGAADFSEGLAAVYIDSAWGYVDTLGNVVIPPRFKSAESFRHGKAVVGVVRKRNNTIQRDEETDWCQWYQKPEWTGAHFEYVSFNEKCALCADCFVGVIDRTGKFVIQPNYKSAWILQPGLYKVGKGDCWGDLGAACYYGILNDQGKDVLTCNFQFSDIINVTQDRQYFLVQKGFEESSPKAIIDKACHVILPYRYYQIRFGPVIDDQNPIAVALETSRGDGDATYTYIFMNLKLEKVIASSFEEASAFYKGVAEVYKAGKPYCIKSNGVLLEYCDGCDCYRK